MSAPRDATPSPDSSTKRRSGVFGSIKRSFSLKGSPLSKEARKDKRASRFLTSNTESEGSARSRAASGKGPSGGSRPQSVAYDRSPLASHPTISNDEGAGTPTNKGHAYSKSEGAAGALSQDQPSGQQGGARLTSPDGVTTSAGDSSTAASQPGEEAKTSESRGDRPLPDSTEATNEGDDQDDSGSNPDQLHRRHRGIMQFQGPRTAKWLKHKAEGVVGQAEKVVKQEEREKAAGMETEV